MGILDLSQMRRNPNSASSGKPSELRSSSLKIVIVDESSVRAAILEAGLREAGYLHVQRIAETDRLLGRIYEIDPDVILIGLENPSRDVLEQMFQMSRTVKRPIAMFVDQSDSAAIQAAVDAGVSAYIVDGLKKERVTSILDALMKAKNINEEEAYNLLRKTAMNENKRIIEVAQSVLTVAELFK